MAVVGVVLSESPRLEAELVMDTDRVLEGEAVIGSCVVRADITLARLDVVVPVTGPFVAAELVAAWSVFRPRRETTWPLQGIAERWGLVRFGPIWVRAHGPLGLIRWQGALNAPVTVRVLPATATLRRLLPHPDPRTSAGAHLGRRPGDGIELAGLRPYQAGDRLRSINWPVSSRRGDLWVTERRPERAADLVVMVDTFGDDPSGGSLALTRSARAAWLVAMAHLEAHDRVGLVAFGAYPTWVTPGSGDHARYEFLDRLLAAATGWTEAARSVQLVPRRALPPGASVVAVSPLHDRRMVQALAALRRRGTCVSVIRVDAGEIPIPPGGPTTEAWDAGRRIWTMELERRASFLDEAGVAVVAWEPRSDAAVVLEALSRVVRSHVWSRAWRERPA